MPPETGSWALAQEMFERGDPGFVDELRRVTDADALGAFAQKWLRDPRPYARETLIDYLSRPMNAYRHEALIKRLFKLAEEANDDEVMGSFLVLFDRSIRHVRKKRRLYRWEQPQSREAAQARAAEWANEGFEVTGISEWGNRFYVSATKEEEIATLPRNDTISRPTGKQAHRPQRVNDYQRRLFEKQKLFSHRTRKYLRRRAWRYFRKLGKAQAPNYVPALAGALRRYEDADVADELALLNNWGLMHALFHHSEALAFPAKGCQFAEGKSFADLRPAPYFPELWNNQPGILFDLLRTARSRTVRLWSIWMLHGHEDFLATLAVEEIFTLLSRPEPEVVSFAAELLRHDARLDAIAVDRWLQLLDTDNPDTMIVLCELMSARLRPHRVSLADAVRLARARPLPVARLGFDILRTKKAPSAEDAEMLLGLAEAECEVLRPDLVRWVRGLLQSSLHFRKEWVLDFLDSRFSDVRAEGWAWLEGDANLRNDLTFWQKLFESPYDDVKLKLIGDLEKRIDQGDLVLTRFLWASVLVNIHRGGRSKPRVVQQVVHRIVDHPDEARELLPLLAIALRSIRGPEFRAGLAGVVQLTERRPELTQAIKEVFVELTL